MKLKGCFLSKSVDWRTPKKVYDKLNKEFNFNYDPCPYQSEDKTFLLKDWKERVYCNPPYNNIYEFVNKGLIELKRGNSQVLVYLLPVRTDTKWFHDLVLPNHKQIRFIRGRLRFNESNNNAPFPSMIVIFKND